MSEPLENSKHREALDLLIRGFQVSRMIRLVADLEDLEGSQSTQHTKQGRTLYSARRRQRVHILT